LILRGALVDHRADRSGLMFDRQSPHHGKIVARELGSIAKSKSR
jgi:hypothetical protein